MRFNIVHETTYEYSNSVFFEPHTLRFRPKNTPFLDLNYYNLTVCPKPSGEATQLDAENNFVGFYWFEGMHNQLSFKWELSINVDDFNPFNFIVYPDSYLKLPFKYSDDLNDLLSASLKYESLNQLLLQYGQNLLELAKGNTLDFIIAVTKQIHTDFTLVFRGDGEPFSANDTFSSRQGACRDLAWMQIQLLRSMGIASRFVSGYYYLPLDSGKFELHAWIEIYLPGAGWVGFDPSHGIVCGAMHLPIASSANYKNTMPISGFIRGDAQTTMHTKLSITLAE